jgi:hypothetical protein
MWLAAEPVDMRAGADRLLMSVVQTFGAARSLNQGRFALPVAGAVHPLPALSQAQFDALVLGLPWQRLEPFWTTAM